MRFQSGMAAPLAAVVWMTFTSASTALADTQKLGPLPLKVIINKVPLTLIANITIDINSARGDFNAQGDLTISASPEALTSAAAAIAQTIPPYDIKNDDCDIRIHKITAIEIKSQSNEIRAKGTAVVSLLDCSARVRFSTSSRDERDVGFEIAIQPLASPKKLELKIMRPPTISLPTSWWSIKKFGNVEEKLYEKIKKAFSASPVFTVPTPYGARIAIQGASIGSDDKTLSVLLRGDAHIDPVNATKLIGYMMSSQKLDTLDIPISLPSAPTN